MLLPRYFIRFSSTIWSNACHTFFFLNATDYACSSISCGFLIILHQMKCKYFTSPVKVVLYPSIEWPPLPHSPRKKKKKKRRRYFLKDELNNHYFYGIFQNFSHNFIDFECHLLLYFFFFSFPFRPDVFKSHCTWVYYSKVDSTSSSTHILLNTWPVFHYFKRLGHCTDL